MAAFQMAAAAAAAAAVVAVVATTTTIAPSTAHAEPVITKRAALAWTDRGWTAHWHKTAKGKAQVIALNKNSLKIEVVDPHSGKVEMQDSLNSNNKRPQLIETLSAQNGEFFVAFSKQKSKVIELHSIGRDLSFEVESNTTPLNLNLTELGSGEIFLTIASVEAIEVYQRKGEDLELVSRLTGQNPFKQTQTLRTHTNDLILLVQDTEGNIKTLLFDASQNKFLERHHLNRPSSVNTIAANDKGDILLASVQTTDGNEKLQIFVNGKPSLNQEVTLSSAFGTMGWIRLTDGRPAFAGVRRTGNSTQIQILLPQSPNQNQFMTIADAKWISDIEPLSIQTKPYLLFIKDEKFLYVQNEDESLVADAKDNQKLISAVIGKLNTGDTSVAVMSENQNGMRLQVVSLAPESALSLLRKAGSSIASKEGNSPKSR